MITFKLADNSYFKWQFRYVLTNCLAFELLILVSGCGGSSKDYVQIVLVLQPLKYCTCLAD